MVLWLLACATEPPERACGPEECAAVCPDPLVAPAPAPAEGGPPPAEGGAPAARLSDFERGLLDPVLADIRAGVRPWDEQAIGVCAGKRECTTFLGADAGELPPGDHFLKAELRVPSAGEKGAWKVRVETICTSPRPEGEPEVHTFDRTYEVWYAGPDRGYRLMPLRTIESPSKGGPQKCTWSLTAPHPDGPKVYRGSWSTPGR